MTTTDTQKKPDTKKPEKPPGKASAITRGALKDAIRCHNGNAKGALGSLGISEGHYYRLLNQHDLAGYARHLRQSQSVTRSIFAAMPALDPEFAIPVGGKKPPVRRVVEPSPAAKTADLIRTTCDQVRDMLLEKNQAYGDSALDPVRVFSKADPIEQLRVRIDDKLSRMVRGQNAGEDAELDLIGYLVLLRIAKTRKP